VVNDDAQIAEPQHGYGRVQYGMKHRAWVVAFSLLALAAGLLVWHFSGSSPAGPAPLLGPPAIARATDAALPPVENPFGTGAGLPKALTGDVFSKMLEEFSEPGGYFMYENYVSNERSYQDPIPSLLKVTRPGGVYLGVGPEQNFTYIAAIRPAMAFIIDIRRQNMVEHLMYKALFTMAGNRVEFVSLLFSRRPSAELNESSSADELFRAFADVQPDSNLFESNLKRMTALLSLEAEDEKTLRDVYHVFYTIGSDLNYSSTNSFAPSGPSYVNLMTLTDADGRNWSYLASEEPFRFLRDMERKNLIVPLVGDFAGPKAIRSVARYLKDHQAHVSAFYLSNVEMYILASPQWKSFCANVASLPVDESSMFIRFLLGAYARAISGNGFGPRNVSVIGPMIDVLTGVTRGYPPSYYDLIHASR
jgi:hypothetical protein